MASCFGEFFVSKLSVLQHPDFTTLALSLHKSQTMRVEALLDGAQLDSAISTADIREGTRRFGFRWSSVWPGADQNLQVWMQSSQGPRLRTWTDGQTCSPNRNRSRITDLEPLWENFVAQAHGWDVRTVLQARHRVWVQVCPATMATCFRHSVSLAARALQNSPKCQPNEKKQPRRIHRNSHAWQGADHREVVSSKHRGEELACDELRVTFVDVPVQQSRLPSVKGGMAEIGLK